MNERARDTETEDRDRANNPENLNLITTIYVYSTIVYNCFDREKKMAPLNSCI